MKIKPTVKLLPEFGVSSILPILQKNPVKKWMGLILSLLLSLGLPLTATAEEKSEMTGRVEMRTVDCFNTDSHVHDDIQYLLLNEKTGIQTKLLGDDKILKQLKPNQKIRVKGIRKAVATKAKAKANAKPDDVTAIGGEEGDFEAESIEVMEEPEVAAVSDPAIAAAAPALKMLSCLLVFASSTDYACAVSETNARGRLFNNATNANLGMQAITKGRYGLQLGNGTTKSPVVNMKLNVSSVGKTAHDMEKLMLTALTDLGYDRYAYDRVLLYPSAGIKSFTAYAYLTTIGSAAKGRVSVYGSSYGNNRMNGYLHELGHNFGFHHSSKGTEYGDRTCVMGSSNHGTNTQTYNVAKLLETDWLTPYPDSHVAVSSDKTLDLYPLHIDPSQSSKTIAVSIPGSPYFVSYHVDSRPYGMLTQAGDRNRVFVYKKESGDFKKSFQVANLGPGETFNAGTAVIRFEAYGPSNAYATVSFDLPGGNTQFVNAGLDQSYALNSWTPANLTTTGWYDASDASSVTASSDTVSQWRDKSGNGLHLNQVSSIQRPLTSSANINGKNAIKFDGSDDTMTTASNPFGASISDAFVIAVHKVDTDNRGALFTLTGSSVQANHWQARAPWGNGDAYFDVGGASGANRLQTSYGVSAGSNVLVSFYGSTTHNVQQVFKNGALLMDDATGHSVNTAGNIFVGSAGAGGSYQNTSMGEFIIIKGTVSPADRQKLEGYLAHKWGLAASLPIGHPYKVAAPDVSSAMVNLNGTVSDPNGDPQTTRWSVISGPTGVTFANPSAVDTTATFTAVGTYRLRLTANDGYSTVFDECIITVDSANPHLSLNETSGTTTADANGGNNQFAAAGEFAVGSTPNGIGSDQVKDPLIDAEKAILTISENKHGYKAGTLLTRDELHMAYIESPWGIRLELGTLGGENSYAFSINDQGTVYGTAQKVDGTYHAFQYSRDEMLEVGALGNIEDWNLAQGVDGVGANLVGSSEDADGIKKPVVFGNAETIPHDVPTGWCIESNDILKSVLWDEAVAPE